METLSEQTVESIGADWLKVEGTDLGGHDVINAETGEKVGLISSVTSTIVFPAGIYHVTVGSAKWKSVEIKARKTTVLK